MPELHTNKLGSKIFLPFKELVLELGQEVPLQIRSHLVTRKEPFE